MYRMRWYGADILCGRKVANTAADILEVSTVGQRSRTFQAFKCVESRLLITKS